MTDREKQALAISMKYFREEKKWSQKQVAEKLNISERYVRRIESGEGCSDYVFQSYVLLTKNLSDLGVVYDYVKIRVHISDVTYVIEDILKMKKDEFESTYKYHRGFDMTYEHLHGGILIHFDTERAENGILIEIQGRGCRFYETILSKNEDSWNDYFYRCVKLGANATRIDLAITEISWILKKVLTFAIATVKVFLPCYNPTLITSSNNF